MVRSHPGRKPLSFTSNASCCIINTKWPSGAFLKWVAMESARSITFNVSVAVGSYRNRNANPYISCSVVKLRMLDKKIICDVMRREAEQHPALLSQHGLLLSWLKLSTFHQVTKWWLSTFRFIHYPFLPEASGLRNTCCILVHMTMMTFHVLNGSIYDSRWFAFWNWGLKMWKWSVDLLNLTYTFTRETINGCSWYDVEVNRQFVPTQDWTEGLQRVRPTW